jgi:pimeloyl-ACP methyl ester carboxylesterase
MALHVAEYGPQSASAKTIVFLHGGGGAGWMWAPQVDALSTDFHVLVPDLPEQGLSTDAGEFEIGSAARQVAELIRERAHGGRAVVVGLSEGAQVGLQLLAAEPDVVEKAVLSSPLVRPLPGGGLTSARMLRWSYRASIAPFRNVAWWIRLNMHSAAGVPDAYYDDFAESFRTLSESGFVDLMLANQRYRLPAGLSAVAVPTLVVVGEHEYAAMKGSATDIASALADARAFEVHHPVKRPLAQEHNWNLVEPELFTRTVRAWIEGGELPPELVALRA